MNGTRRVGIIGAGPGGLLEPRDARPRPPGPTTAGFPNLFMLYDPNTNNGSIIYECQADYLVRMLEWMDAKGLDWVDVRPEVEASYNEQLQHDLDTIGVRAADGCHNYYRGASGRIETQWPHSMSEYRRRTEVPDPDDLVTSHG